MRYSWEQFRIALGFLTVLPVARSLQTTPERLGRSMALFPAVGLLLGLILIVLNSLLDDLIPRAVLDFLLLLVLIVLAGDLHLDGLSDLFDNLSPGRSHSSEGLGVVGLVILLFLKYLCLFNLPLEIKSAGLLFMPAAGRWFQVVLAASCRHLKGRERGRSEFLEHAGERELLIACSSLIVVAFILFGLQGIFVIFLLGIVAIVLIKYFEIRLGGVTGDVVGASSELVEVLSLLLVLAVI